MLYNKSDVNLNSIHMSMKYIGPLAGHIGPLVSSNKIEASAL
jgi:hypothetical protein